MSGTDIPYGTGAGSRSWSPGREESNAGTESTGVKERASAAASQAGEAGRETMHEAKERARDVAHEATDRTRGLVDRTRTELSSQVASQQEHLAGGLRALGDELGQMSSGSDDPGYATDLVQRAGAATGQVAQWFEEREPSDVLHEVEDFARRRPGMFILMAAGAGLLVGRLLRGAKDAPGGGDGSGGGGRGAGEARRDVDRSRPTAGAPTNAGGLSGTGAGPVGSGAQGGEPDIGRSGAFPALANSNLPQDPQVPSSAGETPPAFPPPTADGVRPQTTGGERDVEHP
ncbi:hypothetical protein [Promicromonospora iranensis]|uniref:ElaB/YqjD/DUF883 family membrane-anchored ribosome-binding protein n=1 Tax=Promicromonospora iranensis TaxID=1105144 RepID=A0ABU2CWG1_9MICO|nr:hypothetical protein [Promicromonospora iranensis]MDR7385665.1 ElaB/YqjD/DUF883 family membrane-anchored ribosome-binding protein [Promicromonospora iranensis]